MSLAAYYKLDGNSNEELFSRSGTSATVTWVSGRIGQAASFNGTASYFGIPYSTILLQHNVLSTSCWFKVTAWDASSEAVLSGWSQYDWGNVRVSASTLYVRWAYDDAQKDLMSGSFAFSLNTWYHLVVSYGPTTSAYVNGVLVTSKTTSVLPSNHVIAYWGGNINVSGGTSKRYLNGVIDDIKIYNHTLSTKEAHDLYLLKVLHYTFDIQEEYTVNALSSRLTVPYFTSAYNGTNYSFGATTDLQQVYVDEHPIDPRCGITKVSRITGGTNQADYVALYGITSPANSTTVLSFWYYGTYGTQIRCYNNDGNETLQYLDTNGAWAGSGTYVNIPVSENKWNKIVVKIVANSTGGLGIPWMILHVNSINATLTSSEYWLFTAWQLETKDHATDFTVGTRTAVINDGSEYSNSSDALNNNCPEWRSGGVVGSGKLLFNGTSQFFSGTNLPLTSSYLSISVWTKPTVLDNSVDMILETSTNWNSNTGAIAFDINDSSGTSGRVLFGFKTATSYVYGYFNYPDTNEHHLVGVIDLTQSIAANAVSVYLDSVKQTLTFAASSSERPSLYTNSFYVGSRAGTNYFFNGTMDDMRIYSQALTQKNITDLYLDKASITDQAGVLANELIENTHYSYDPFIRNTNLVLNGSQQLESNSNFSTCTYNADGYLSITGLTQTVVSNEYIPINQFDTYSGELEVRYGDITSTFYAGFACYDKNKNMITHSQVNHYVNTETTLSAPLNNGDTIVYLTSSANWQVTGASTTYKFIALWDATTEEYPIYTYTRTVAAYTTLGTNQITLTAPWAGSTIPTGTSVANAFSGGTFTYCYASAASTQQKWTKYGGSSVESTGWNINVGSNAPFRYGTKFIRFLILPNYNTTATTHFRNIKFWNKTSNQLLAYSQDDINISNTGIIHSNEFIEFPSKGLIAKYGFDQASVGLDTSGNGRNLTQTGTVPLATGILGTCCSFSTATLNFLSSASTYFKRDELSVSLWFNSSGLGGGMTINGLFAITYGFRVFINSAGNVSFGTWNISGGSYITTSGIPSLHDGLWHHLVIVYGNTGGKWVYIDGELNVYGTHIARWNWTNAFYLGVDPNDTNLYRFNGLIDEVHVYNRTLYPNEVNILYNQKNSSYFTNNFAINASQILEG